MACRTEQATLNREENGSDSDHLSKEPIVVPILDWDRPTDLVKTPKHQRDRTTLLISLVE